MRYLLLTAALFVALPGYPADVVMMVGDNPPINSFHAGKPEGMAVEIVDEMLNRAKLEAEHPHYPWVRIYNLAQSHTNHCAYGVSRIPERERLFQWIGPIASNDWAFFATKKQKISLAKLEDALNYRVGGQRKDGKATWLEKKGFTLDYATEESQTIKKLMSGKIDLYPAGVYSVPEIARRNHIDPALLEPVFVFQRVDLYIACSPATEKPIIEKLQQSLDGMKSDGALKRIWQKHHQRIHPASAGGAKP